jgi:hypothetical protein
MADPKIDPNLTIFLNYDFANQDNHNMQLGVYKDASGEKHLGLFDKVSKNFMYENVGDYFPEQAQTSLKKTVKFVQEHQDLWYKQYPQSKVQLETQMAWLERKVTERNHTKKLAKNINYQNPAQWKLNIEIMLPKTNDAELKIQTRSVSKQFAFDRLTTNDEVLQKCQKAWNSHYVINIHCPRCGDHATVLKLSKMFSHSTIGNQYKNFQIAQKATEVFISTDKITEDQTIIIRAEQLKEKALTDHLKNDHEAPPALSHWVNRPNPYGNTH